MTSGAVPGISLKTVVPVLATVVLPGQGAVPGLGILPVRVRFGVGKP